MRPFAHVAGWGMYVPEQVLTNDDLSRRVDTSDEWIRTRTGIVERRIAPEGETTSTMAIEAARQALSRANVSPASLDAIIVATISSDYLTPSTSCLVQAGLGAIHACAFDLGAGCSGFVYALAVARMGIAAGDWSTVLVIGAETLSRFTDWEDRNTCVLFGDGAGALVLVGREEDGGILSTALGADGSGADLLFIPAGGSHLPASPETVANRLHSIRMDGPAVFRFATRIMPDSVTEALDKANLPITEVDMVIPHQANNRILESARKKLKLPEEAVFINLERYGNTSAASIPIALCEAVEGELINDGSLLALVGFGAGLTWGTAVLRWGVPLPVLPRPWWRRGLHQARSLGGRARMLVRRLLYLLWKRLPFDRE